MRDTTEDGVTALAAEIDAIIAGAYAPAERAALPPATLARSHQGYHGSCRTCDGRTNRRAARCTPAARWYRAAPVDKAAQRKMRRADKAPARYRYRYRSRKRLVCPAPAISLGNAARALPNGEHIVVFTATLFILIAYGLLFCAHSARMR